MGFGLTTQGFVIKRLSEIKSEIETDLRDALGVSINLLPTELLGQLVGIFSEREALIWELAQDVYNSQYPDTASGVSLDNVVALTGIKRLEAVKAKGNGVAEGDQGTVIPVGSVFSVQGNSEARFVTTEAATLDNGVDDVQLVAFSSVPDAGNFTLKFDGEETGLLFFNSTNSDVQNELNNLVSLSSGTTVTGNFTSGFSVTFTGTSVNERLQQLITIGSNILEVTSTDVSINISKVTNGQRPNANIPVEAETAGDVRAPSGTLTVIEETIVGLDTFTNPQDIDNGKEIEKDAELRIRRKQTLATSGAATVEAIRAALLNIDEVTAARVFQNYSMITDAFGRPPKSFEAVVVDGDEDEIAEVIWQTKPAGIETHGSIVKTVVDSQGFNQAIEFSRPTQIDIWIDLILTTDPSYPVDGDDVVKQAIVDFATDKFSIGDDVITKELYCAIFEIEGVIDAEILIGTTPSPISDANIIIEDDEIADFDTGRITI